MLNALKRRWVPSRYQSAAASALPSATASPSPLPPPTRGAASVWSGKLCLRIAPLLLLMLLVINLGLILIGGDVNAMQWMNDHLPFRRNRRSISYVSLRYSHNPRKVVILQTSDGTSSYAHMLDAMQSVQLAYASQYKLSYLRWDGIARGKQQWLATYNRIYLLHELYRQRRYDWVLYMDPGI